MPAQILPMLGDVAAQSEQAHLQLEQQRAAFEQHVQQTQLNMQQAQFQVEQQLNPLRQQILQNEFQRGQLAVKQAAQMFTQSQFEGEQARTRAPVENQLLGSQASRAASEAKQSGMAASEFEADAGYRAKIKQNQLDQDALNQELGKSRLAGDTQTRLIQLQQDIREQQTHDLQQKLGTSALDEHAQQLAAGKASAVSGILGLPKAQRDLMADVYHKSGLMDDATYAKVATAPDLAKDYVSNIAANLGPDKAHDYELLSEKLKAPTPDPLNPGKFVVDEGTWTKLHAIDKMNQDVMDMKDNFKFAPELPKDPADLEVGTVYQIKDPKTGQVAPWRYTGLKGDNAFKAPQDPKYRPKAPKYTKEG